jgi:VIT1/CCC1 family predicted Fe2+/Mn2+ transporter
MSPSMNIPDQIDYHFNAIFLVWFAAFVAASLTSVSVKGHRLRHACSGIAVAVLAAPLVYLTGLMLWVLVVQITR